MIRRGLTVVELAVVMVILVVLIAGGAYMIVNALATARALGCADNLKVLGVALQTTVHETPITGIPGLRGNALPKVQDAAGVTWKDELTRKGGATDNAFLCPESAMRDRPSFGMNPLAGAMWSYPRGMFYGGFLLLPGETRPCNVDLIRAPARTIIVTDAGRVVNESDAPAIWTEQAADWQPYVALPFSDPKPHNGGKGFEYGYDWGNTAPGSTLGGMKWDPLRRPLPRHASRCNTLFLDGHAETLEMPRIVAPAWGSPECLSGNQ